MAHSAYHSVLKSDEGCEEQVFYKRVLKQVLQFAADACPVPMNCVQSVSLSMVANNLIGLETDLPPELLGGQSFSTWHQWRMRVVKAETAAGLASEVRG